MREPAFWWRPAGIAAGLLSPLGAIYGAVAARRMAQRGSDAGIPVLCIGNLTVGGAGKTPTALAVVELLLAAGKRPFVLSRGYGGALSGPVRVDPATHSAADVGDEPLLLARATPTVVARDRVAGAAFARAAGADVVVMDDGFQNPSLVKRLSIVVVDGRRDIGNGCVIPSGPLRAPLNMQLDRADAILVIGGTTSVSLKRPAFHAALEPDPQAVAMLKPRKVLAFAGIGNPEKFFATLIDAGIDVRARIEFPDHHRYRRAEAADLIARAGREDLALVTTEKDIARLSGQDDCAALASIARALPVKLVVKEADRFRALVLGAV